MKRTITALLLVIATVTALAQGQIRGLILDKNTSEAMSFVSVALTPQGESAPTMGASSDSEGKFHFKNVKFGTYTLTLSFVGYKEVRKQVELNEKNHTISFAALYMKEDANTLNEVQVTGQRSAMKLEVDRKSFDVAGMVTSAGLSASELLEQVPSVEVDNDGNVSLRGNTSVEVWINGRSSGLTSDNQAQVLQQLPAESIERIEVIDNPSAKFSAEGSAGIINIILKKDRKAGYYGSVQVGANTRGGANTSLSLNYNSSKIDAFLNVGYRHMENSGKNESEQDNLVDGIAKSYERHYTENSQLGNNLFSRAGFTWHADEKNDLGLTGMFMTGKRKSSSSTPYYYGDYTEAGEILNHTRLRNNSSNNPMRFAFIEFNYRHLFSEKHFIDFTASHMNMRMDNNNFYQDSIWYEDEAIDPHSSYQSRPMKVRNHHSDIKLQYENAINDKVKLEAGYNGSFSHESSPQESFEADNWYGIGLTEDKAYFNRFVYDNDIHALYASLSYKFNKLSIMAGLRGEYWRINTESLNWQQEHGEAEKDKPFKKDYFQLFPSLFMSYQITQSQQLQLNYTRRLRRPWGGELNSFRNTSDASIISFGNPLLTPEFSNSFSLNYLKTWEQHSLLVSAYYRPTTDVIQRVNYRNTSDNLMYRTPENVAKSTATGVEITAKNKLWKILDLTTNVNLYHYKLDAFSYNIEGQTVNGEAQNNFTWNARIMAALRLPYDISVQVTGTYNSRQVITQGHRPASYVVDMGVRKNFLNRMFTLSVNCRDLLNSRKWESYTNSDTFSRYQLNRRRSRTVNFTLTWNFGNQSGKKKKSMERPEEEEEYNNNGYDM
ncbi:MAG: TonB-dependent receptor [Prevotella sp.]|nr:TonB-dependent receptor [Prevotella sp.]